VQSSVLVILSCPGSPGCGGGPRGYGASGWPSSGGRCAASRSFIPRSSSWLLLSHATLPLAYERYASIHSAPSGRAEGRGRSTTGILCLSGPLAQTATISPASLSSIFSTITSMPSTRVANGRRSFSAIMLKRPIACSLSSWQSTIASEIIRSRREGDMNACFGPPSFASRSVEHLLIQTDMWYYI